MGARPGPGDFPHRLLRRADAWERRVGRGGDGQGRALRPLLALASGTLIGLALTWAWKLQTSEAQDLTPSMRWRAPSFANRVADDEGPILAIIEYLIDPSESSAFLAVMQDVSLERKRDGAYAWHMFEDPNEPGQDGRDLPHPLAARTQVPRGARHQGGRDHRGPGGKVFESAGRKPLSGRAAAPAAVALVATTRRPLRRGQCRRRHLASRDRTRDPPGRRQGIQKSKAMRLSLQKIRNCDRLAR